MGTKAPQEMLAKANSDEDDTNFFDTFGNDNTNKSWKMNNNMKKNKKKSKWNHNNTKKDYKGSAATTGDAKPQGPQSCGRSDCHRVYNNQAPVQPLASGFEKLPTAAAHEPSTRHMQHAHHGTPMQMQWAHQQYPILFFQTSTFAAMHGASIARMSVAGMQNTIGPHTQWHPHMHAYATRQAQEHIYTGVQSAPCVVPGMCHPQAWIGMDGYPYPNQAIMYQGHQQQVVYSSGAPQSAPSHTATMTQPMDHRVLEKMMQHENAGPVHAPIPPQGTRDPDATATKLTEVP